MNNLKDKIYSLLNRWRTDSISKEQVLIEAEDLFGKYYKGVDFPMSDYKSILIEILSQLEIINHQWIIKDDIPAILEFMKTSKGNELQAWEKWEEYWNKIDFEKREKLLGNCEFYTAVKPTPNT